MKQDLLQKCQKGDRKAHFQLYRECFAMLMSVCLRYKKGTDEAAIILNTGFFKILSGLKRYNSQIPFEAWAKRIMINTIIDEFRKNRKMRELVEYTDFSAKDTFDDAVDWNLAESAFGVEELMKMINRLPSVSQKVFNLYAIDGYSHKEIAELLGMSVGTSKWHLSSSRKKLQEMILESKEYEINRKTIHHGK